MADFIHVDSEGIIIVTNNIASPSDLQATKKYVKNATCSEPNQVQSPNLRSSKFLRSWTWPLFGSTYGMYKVGPRLKALLTEGLM